MKSIVAIANQKGGVGKTTSAASLGVILSRMGHRVHLIDMDPQADLSTAFGQYDSQGLLYRSLKQGSALPVVPLSETLSLTPSSVDLARGETNFLAEHGREFLLQTSLEKTPLPADALVLIDCPPSLGVLSVNALAAAHHLLVTVHPGGFELRALKDLQATVNGLKQRINPRLNMLGVVLTKCDMREKITPVIQQEVSRVYPFLGLVRKESKLKYATTESRILTLEDSSAMEEYGRVARKVIEQLP